MRLEWLRAHRREEHQIELESGPSGPGNGKVSQMRRIEATAEEGDASGEVGGDHIDILIGPRRLSVRSDTIELIMKLILLILALAGVVVSSLALQVHYSTGIQPCDINSHWDCGIVNHSSYSVIDGIPVAAIGIAGYLALALLVIAERRAVLLGIAIAALAYAIHLSMIEKNVLMVWCLYCVISQGIIALFTIVSALWLIVRNIGKKSAVSAA